ncbi:hypothetical protein AMECASPLE_022776 [Ameca splendens]|uniref:Uncharacterized protein n=1 Tax=Ameca splendens TaxID=208324 RepID=A0ABV1A1X1_9TELE
MFCCWLHRPTVMPRSCDQVADNKNLFWINPLWFWIYLAGCHQTRFLEKPLWFSLNLNGKYFSEFTLVQGPLWIHKIRLLDRSSLHLPCLSTLHCYSPSGGTRSHSTLACQPQSLWLAYFFPEPTHSSTMSRSLKPAGYGILTLPKTQFQ